MRLRLPRKTGTTVTRAEVRQRTSLENIAYSAGSRYLLHILSFAKSFVQAKFLGPTTMGMIGQMSVVLPWGNLVNLGSKEGYLKLVPAYRTRGQADEAEVLKDTSFYFTVAGSIAFFVVLCLYSYLFLQGKSPIYRIGLPLFGLANLLDNMNLDFDAANRLRHNFMVGSVANTLMAIVEIALVVILVYWLNVWALFLALFARYAVSIGYMLRHSRERFRLRVDVRKIPLLVLTGIPLIAVNTLITIIQTIDRLFIIAFLSATAMGFYGFAISLNAMISYATSSVGSVLYPKMIEAYAAERDPEALRPYVYEPSHFLGATMPILVGLLFIAVPPAITYLLPRYEPTGVLVQILLFGALFEVITPTAGTFLIVTNKERVLIGLQIALIAISAVSIYGLIRAGYGLYGVGVGTSLSLCAFAALRYGAVDYYLRIRGRLTRYAMLIGPGLYAFGLAYAVSRLSPALQQVRSLSQLVGGAAINALLFLAGYIPVLLLLWRFTDVFDRFRSLMRGVR